MTYASTNHALTKERTPGGERKPEEPAKARRGEPCPIVMDDGRACGRAVTSDLAGSCYRHRRETLKGETLTTTVRAQDRRHCAENHGEGTTTLDAYHDTTSLAGEWRTMIIRANTEKSTGHRANARAWAACARLGLIPGKQPTLAETAKALHAHGLSATTVSGEQIRTYEAQALKELESVARRIPDKTGNDAQETLLELAARTQGVLETVSERPGEEEWLNAARERVADSAYPKTVGTHCAALAKRIMECIREQKKRSPVARLRKVAAYAQSVATSPKVVAD